MFIKNKYYKAYKAIIKKAKCEDRVKGNGRYFESHHILPKSVYPQYRLNKRNLVLLTAKEHFVCHHVLTKCVEDKHKPGMTLALWRMVHAEQHSQCITATVYSVIKEIYSSQQRERMLADNKGFTFKGRKHKKETKASMMKGTINSANMQRARSINEVTERLSANGFTFLSHEGKYIKIECGTCNNVFKKQRQYLTMSKFNNKMCKTCNPRKPMTKEHRAKIGAAHKGRVVSAETRQKLSNSIKALHRTAN